MKVRNLTSPCYRLTYSGKFIANEMERVEDTNVYCVSGRLVHAANKVTHRRMGGDINPKTLAIHTSQN